MRRLIMVSAVACAFLGLTGCNKPDPENLAYVGGTLIKKQDLDAFSLVTRFYPSAPEAFFLGSRPGPSGLVETEAIYQKARYSLSNIKRKGSQDWKWKKMYYLSFAFQQNIMQPNLGFSENELQKYYDAHKDLFKSAPRADSTGKVDSSLVIRPFDEVKNEIADNLFVLENKPDSAFKARIGSNDSNEVKRKWIEYIRSGDMKDFFMKAYFKKKYGKDCPDSLNELVGKGKPLSSDDLDVIFSWIPADRREEYRKNPQTQIDFAKWLLKWMLFYEKSVSIGYTSTPASKSIEQWAWKLEIAQAYVTTKLAIKAKGAVRFDTAMAVYSYYDQNNTTGVIDTAAFKTHCNAITGEFHNVRFDSIVYSIRKAKKVRFLQDSWKDDRVNNPAVMFAKADSLRDTSNAAEAETIYRSLTTEFLFTQEGKNALVELAKIQTDQQNYNEAIKNYRKYLVMGGDPSKICNTMFMIGFIYDEYLDKPEQAELNYKWVLKNAPDCELVDDAEFMMLHLGEPMSSIDELQAEVKRQNKKVEETSGEVAEGTSEEGEVKTKK